MAILLYDDEAPGGARLAFREDGAAPQAGRCGFFWLGGFRSDMEGAKAAAIAALAHETRRSSLRFDYSGHGRSGGEFTGGTISGWLAQSLHMFRARAPGRRIFIGSSMGGWLALLLLRHLLRTDMRIADRVAGLVLIAPAADMTLDLMWNEFPQEGKSAIREHGIWFMPSPYGEPYPITATLLDDGLQHLILKDGLDVPCPVRILEGDQDRDVPPAHALKVFTALRGADVTFTLIKGGDHRLSTPGNLSLIREAAMSLAERADGTGL